MTNTFEYQCCILMCKTSHCNIIMTYNQKDSLLVEFVIDTLRMQEIETTHLFKNSLRNASYGYRRVHLIIKIFSWLLTLFFDTFGVLYILYLTKRTWEGFFVKWQIFYSLNLGLNLWCSHQFFHQFQYDIWYGDNIIQLNQSELANYIAFLLTLYFIIPYYHYNTKHDFAYCD